MERRKFLKTCCYSAVGLPIIGSVLSSCNSIYYATTRTERGKIIVAKSEFLTLKKDKTIHRKFVLIKDGSTDFPICLYKVGEDDYVAPLLKCTHRGCELNVGGGIYSCPCHGSEFSIRGKVTQGPAEEDLVLFKTLTDNENIYIYA